MMQIVIKPYVELTTQERQGLKDLHLHAHSPMDVMSDYIDIGDRSIAVVYYSVLNPTEVLGWGLLDVHIGEVPVGHVFVREECRRQGIGSMVLNTMRGITSEFDVLPHDQCSNSFYQVNGLSSPFLSFSS